MAAVALFRCVEGGHPLDGRRLAARMGWRRQLQRACAPPDDRPEAMAGMVGFVCRGAGTIGLVHGVAPCWRGQGLATRAVLLAVAWLIRERGAEVVELRVGRDSPACQRSAVKSGFPLAGRRQQRRRGDRQGSRRLALHHRSGRARRSPSGPQLTEPGQAAGRPVTVTALATCTMPM
jgi:RimJ/RimL family protein N-acetyltransferase